MQKISNMDFQSIIPFVIQGVTEFLPISSTAHLIVFSNFFSSFEVNDSLNNAILHLAPAIVICFYFWREVLGLIKNFLFFLKNPLQFIKHSNQAANQFFISILCMTAPIMFVGFFIDILEVKIPHYQTLIGINSIVFGLFLYFFDQKKNHLKHEEITIKQACSFGIFHILALIPGVSRLGISLTILRMFGIKRDTAVKISFLCGMPVLFTAGSYGVLKKLVTCSNNIEKFNFLNFGSLTLLSIFIGFIVLHLFFQYSKHFNFSIFAFYRIILGIILLIFS